MSFLGLQLMKQWLAGQVAECAGNLKPQLVEMREGNVRCDWEIVILIREGYGELGQQALHVGVQVQVLSIRPGS